MNSILPKIPSHTSANSGINPFARAMAETKAGEQLQNVLHDSSPLSDLSTNQLVDQQRAQAERMRLEQMRTELHRKVNPIGIEMTDIFSNRRLESERQLKATRDLLDELRATNRDLLAAHKEIEITLMSESPDVAGDEGLSKWFATFRDNLRSWIEFLKAQISSAQSWATTIQAKHGKRAKQGLQIGGTKAQQGKTIFDQQHHERSTQYSGS